MIPADFSAFNNFNIAKHSYWEKTADEINTFLATGQFPERAQNNTQQAVNTMANTANTYAAPAAPAYQAPAQTAPQYNAPTQPITTTTPYVAPAANNAAIPNAETPVAPATTPVRNFSGFSF